MYEVNLLVMGSIRDMTQEMVGTQEARWPGGAKVLTRDTIFLLEKKHLKNLSIPHLPSICRHKDSKSPTHYVLGHLVAVCLII